MSHVNGALTLVKLRNDSQFRDATGLRLSLRLSTNLLISCVAANSPVPPSLANLRSQIEPFLNKDDPKWQLSGLVHKYADLRGVIGANDMPILEALKQAADLDREFVMLTESMPPDWEYMSVYPGAPSDGVFEQHFDTYKHHFITQTWNVMRVMRILLNDIIRTYWLNGAAPSGENEPLPPYNTIQSTIDGLARDICASAPQYTKRTAAIHKRVEFSATEKLRCYTLIFPLYVAGMYASPDTKITLWIIQELQFMARKIGLRNADIVADILLRADGTSPWDVYAILGSYAFAA